MNFSSLCEKINGSTGVSLTGLEEDYPIIEVQSATATASIALHGAHLISYTPTGQKAVIFTSESAVYKEGKAIRGGIPICWPYFNAHPTEADFPAHGIARNRFWELLSIESSGDGHTLIFEMPIDEKDHNLIGGRCKLTVSFEIADTLKISLTSTNTGSCDLSVGGALHSYFQIGSITTSPVSGLDSVSHLDTLTDETSMHDGLIKIAREYDRVFLPSAHAVTIHDQSNHREIIVTKENSHATTVWNPWIDKSAAMADLGNEDYLSFLCVEAINWKEDLRSIAPGESHSLIQQVSLKTHC